MTIEFLAIEKLQERVLNYSELISFPALISKPTLLKYSELTGQGGKIVLDLKDQSTNINNISTPGILMTENANFSDEKKDIEPFSSRASQGKKNKKNGSEKEKVTKVAPPKKEPKKDQGFFSEKGYEPTGALVEGEKEEERQKRILLGFDDKDKRKSNNFPIRITIPKEEILAMIKEFETSRNWSTIANKYGYSVNIIVKRIKEFLGAEKYKKLISQYSRAYNITIKFSNNKLSVTSLSRDIRNVIIKYIYMKLRDTSVTSVFYLVELIIDEIEQEKSWVKEIPARLLSDFLPRIKPKEIKPALSEYLSTLIKLIIKLMDLNRAFKKEKKPLIIAQFTKDLIKEDLNLSYFENQYIEIFDYIKSQFDDFALERLEGGTSLFNDPIQKQKECSRCHKIKNYNEFPSRGKDTVVAFCKECNQIIFSIRRYKRKYDVWNTLFKGKVECSNPTCELKADFIFLPTLNFHHLDPSKKDISWSDVYMRSFDNVIKILSNEKVVSLCDNCHIKEHKKLFDEFNSIILDENLFQKTVNKIKELIKDANKRQNVVYWFKKRFIVEQLFDGKCAGCGKINVYNNLPALTFHHRNPETKEESWSELRFSKMDEIINIIKEKDLVCLCANCHRLIYSTQFIQNYREIFSKIGLDQSDIEKAGKFYDILFKNIANFKLKSDRMGYPF